VNLEKLVLPGLELEPYEYQEVLEDGALYIRARARLRSRARISLPEAGMAAWWNGRRKGPGREARSDPAVAE